MSNPNMEIEMNHYSVSYYKSVFDDHRVTNIVYAASKAQCARLVHETWDNAKGLLIEKLEG